MRPRGIAGRLFAVATEWINTPAYHRAVELISAGPGDRVLEVGFGTGALLEMLAARISGGLLAGIDPSDLMVRQACARLARHASAVQLDIRPGTDRDLSWPEAHFTQSQDDLAKTFQALCLAALLRCVMGGETMRFD